MFRYRTAFTVLAGMVLLYGSPAALAVVDTIDATVTAEVRAFSGGAQSDSDLAFEDLTETTGNLPLVAEVELFRPDQEEAGATAITIFQDPRATLFPDPDEFSLAVGAFSLTPSLSYQARSNSTEDREITFLAGDIGAADGTSLEARSQFFVDGLLLIWGDVGQTDLTGTLAELTLSVEQTLPTDAGPNVALSAGLRVVGQSDGSVTVTATGGLGLENVTVVDLTGLSGNTLGAAHAVIIPATTALPYIYPAQVGETFVLKAEIEAEAHCQPNTGAAVELGVPLLDLAALINNVTGGQVGDPFQQFLQLTLDSSPPAAKPLLPAAQGTTVTVTGGGPAIGTFLPFCGPMGIESVLLLTLFAMAAGLLSRRAR